MQIKTHNFGGYFRDNNRQLSDITSGMQLVDQGLSLMFRDSWSLCNNIQVTKLNPLY